MEIDDIAYRMESRGRDEVLTLNARIDGQDYVSAEFYDPARDSDIRYLLWVAMGRRIDAMRNVRA